MTNEDKINNLRLSNEESNKFTCECLKTALFHLISHKDFDDISIADVIRESGVSRNSFYRNYGSMDALFNALREEVLTEVSEFLKSYEHYGNKKDWFVDLFDIVRKKQREFRILLEIRIPLNFFSQGIDFGKLLPVSLAEPTYERLSLAGSFLIVLYHWFTTGMKESSEEMAEICSKLFPDEIL